MKLKQWYKQYKLNQKLLEIINQERISATDIFSFSDDLIGKAINLIRRWANPNMVNIYGNTPMHFAASNQMDKLAESMSPYVDNTYLNAQNNLGDTSMHLFLFYKKNKLVKSMLKKGANPDIKNKIGVIVADQIRSSKNQELITALEETKSLVEIETKSRIFQTVIREEEVLEEDLNSSGYESSNSSNSLQNSQELSQL